MENLEKFFINGQWVEPISTEKMPVLNPANQNEIGHGIENNHRHTSSLTGIKTGTKTERQLKQNWT